MPNYFKQTSHYTILFHDKEFTKNTVWIFVGRKDGLIKKCFITTKYKRKYYRFRYDNQNRITYYGYTIRNMFRKGMKSFALRSFNAIPSPNDKWYKVVYDLNDVMQYEDSKGSWYNKDIVSSESPYPLGKFHKESLDALAEVNDYINDLNMKYSRGDEHKDTYYTLDTIYQAVRKWLSYELGKSL